MNANAMTWKQLASFIDELPTRIQEMPAEIFDKLSWETIQIDNNCQSEINEDRTNVFLVKL